MKKFKYKIISIQTWNNNNEQYISSHKTLSAAIRAKKANEKYEAQNILRIDEIK